jgi:hypothetical protein
VLPSLFGLHSSISHNTRTSLRNLRPNLLPETCNYIPSWKSRRNSKPDTAEPLNSFAVVSKGVLSRIPVLKCQHMQACRTVEVKPCAFLTLALGDGTVQGMREWFKPPDCQDDNITARDRTWLPGRALSRMDRCDAVGPYFFFLNSRNSTFD